MTTETYRQTLGAVIRSEWIKLRTLRSTWIGMAAVLVLMIGIAAIAAAVVDEKTTGTRDLLRAVLAGADFSMLLLGILGALAGAREYGSRMITATMIAVPRRGHVVLAKAITVGGLIAATSVIGVLGAFGVGTALRMVFRIKERDEARGYSRYFWKAAAITPHAESN